LIKDQLKAKAEWKKESMDECYRSWIQDRSVSLYTGLPSIMISNIWWARNSSIFKDKSVPPKVTVTLTLSMEEEFKEDLREQKTQTLIPPPIDYVVPWGYFDGAYQGHPPKCGVGPILFINHNH